MTLSFTKATKTSAKLRLALIGPAGSGKTYSALAIASGLGRKIAVLDTEHGSASKYADVFSFDSMQPPSFNPQVYIDAIAAASAGGYDVLVIDSLSHAWAGKGGALEMVDAAAKRLKGNSYVAWGEVTPLQTQMIDAILAADLHIIATMRSKMEYVQERDSNGRTTVRKIGLQPVQREGVEFEFDVMGDLSQDNELVISKTRCPALSGAIIKKPGKPLADTLLSWLAGEAPEPKPAVATEPVTPAVGTAGASTSAPAASKPAAPAPKPPAAATKPTTVPSSPKTNGTMREPAVLRAALVAFASRTPVAAGEQFVKNAMASLHNLVRGDDTKRKAIMQYMFGKDSGNDLTAGECMALTQWIGMSKTNNEWAPAAMAITEGDAVLREYEKERGQQEMPF